MTATTPAPPTQAGTATAPVGAGKSGWGVVHYLALVGAVLLGLQAWTYVAWLADGPYQTTAYQDPDDATWVIARVYEIGFGLILLGCLVYVVRKCLRERRLVFDAKLMIAGMSVIWLDPFTNFFAPIWFYSTQWTNLNAPLGYMPGVINPTLEDMPFPLFHVWNYPVALLMAGIIVSTMMAKIRNRWPGLSNAQLIGVCALLGMLFDFCYEMPFFRLELWAMPGSADEVSLFAGDARKYPVLLEMIPAGLAFATFGALRYFKDDRGREITERGLDAMPARRRSIVSVVALCGLVQLVWIGSTSFQAIGGFYADPYKPMPAHLVNEMCDAPLEDGTRRTGTRYGACPQEGGDIPIRDVSEP